MNPPSILRPLSSILLSVAALLADPAGASSSDATAGVAAWVPVGPWGGRVLDVAASPTVAGLRLATVVVPIGQEGLYRSTDSGQSWQVVPGPGFDTISLSDVDFGPDGTAYLATSDHLRVSADGGLTWTQVVNPFHSLITAVTIGPASGDLWLGLAGFLGGGFSVIRSSDGGGTWEDVSPPQFGMTTALLLVAGSPTTVYAGYCCSLAPPGEPGQGGLWKTVDGGGDWELVSDDLPAAQITSLAWDGSRVLAGGGVASNDDPFGLFASEDGGASWVPLHDESWPGLFVLDVAIAPDDPSLLLAATEVGGVHRSEDGGATWTLGVAGTADQLVHAVGFAGAGSDEAFAGSEPAGVLRSLDGGASFTASAVGMTALRIVAAAVHPGDPLTMAAAWTRLPDRGGVFTSDDGGASWSREPLPATRHGLVEFAPDGTLYAVSTGPRAVAPEGVYRRETDGSWTPLGPDPGGPFELRGAALRFSAGTPGLVFLSGSGHGTTDYGAAIWRSLDGGGDWQQVYASPDHLLVTGVEILADGTDQTLVAGLRSKIGGALRSIDGGGSWLPSVTGLAGVTAINGLCASPTDAQRLYLATEFSPRALYTTLDGGLTWDQAGPLATDLRGVACDQDAHGVLYAATAVPPIEILRSFDHGASFEPFGPGFKASSIHKVITTTDPAALLAATSAGVWRRDLPVLFADGFETGDSSQWTVSTP